MMTMKKSAIACGDFNIDMADLYKPHSKLLNDVLTTHSLQQPINIPTRFSATCHSILDLFITSSDIPISESSVLDLPISDHLPILLDIPYTVPKPTPSLVTRRVFKKFSENNFFFLLSLGRCLMSLTAQMIRSAFSILFSWRYLICMPPLRQYE